MSTICSNINDVDVSAEPGQALRPLRWEHITCNLCGLDDTTIYHRERLPYFDTILDFDIVQCRHCKLVYTNPRLTEHNAVYDVETATNPQQVEKQAQTKRIVFEKALKQIIALRQNSPRGKLLDVGSGTGHFLAAAKKYGFETQGIELASGPANYAMQYLQLDIIVNDVLETHLPAKTYDIITAWDVIEHVSDPKAVLQECTTWLKDDGILALRFPSASFQKVKAIVLHKILNSKHAAFAPTMHLTFFDVNTFKKLAKELGLEIIKFKTTPLEPNTGNLVLNTLKRICNLALITIEKITAKHFGNIEVYCRKVAP